VLISCWSTKGGTGTTVVAAGLALLLARSTGAALAADLAGDLPLALGLPLEGARARPGLAEWSAAAPEVAADALGRLEEPVTESLGLLRRGAGALSAAGAPLLAGMLAADPRPVVVDCGRVDAGDGSSAVVAAAAERSLLVLRPCFLGLRRAVDAPIRATGVVLLTDDARILGAADVEATLGIPVVARVRVNDAVARAVDAGLLAGRVPRTLIEDLRRAA